MRSDILACYDNTWVDKLIRKVTGQNITHIAIQITENLLIEATVFGVVIRPISSKGGKFHRLHCIELSRSKQMLIIEFLLSKVGSWYDYLLFLTLGLSKLTGRDIYIDGKGSYICVELAVDAFNHVGVDLLEGRDLNSILPEDLMYSDKLEVIG